MGILSSNRLCRKCNKKKPASEFRRDSTQNSNLHPYCKACVKVHHDENADVLVCANSACGREFIPANNYKRKYCSSTCERATARARYGKSEPACGSEIPTGTKGAFAELIACADLLRRGYDVFRAVSPSAPCDLIITKGTTMYRIEVRTAYRISDGKIVYGVYAKDGPHRHDIVAAVVGTEVVYLDTGKQPIELP